MSILERCFKTCLILHRFILFADRLSNFSDLAVVLPATGEDLNDRDIIIPLDYDSVLSQSSMNLHFIIKN